MSSDPGKSPGGPWQSNGTYPAQADTGPETPNLENDRPENLPTPEERISGLLDGHPDKMLTPISTDHGRKLREEALQEPEEVTREVEIGGGYGCDPNELYSDCDECGGEMEKRMGPAESEFLGCENYPDCEFTRPLNVTETRRVSETVSRGALPLVAVMEEFLEWYEGYRNKYLKMAKGDGFREGKKEFLVELDNSFQPSYQKQTYARLQALRRQTAGGEYPDGSECAGVFEEPVTVLFGLTASGVGSDGMPRPIVDHAREVREAWVGSSESTKRTLRYVLEDKLGLESDEYAWWYQSEPHPGDGANAGYSHAHPVVVLDRAAASVESVEAEDFRAVVAKHVAECDSAEWAGHPLERSVTVKEPGEIMDFGQYVSEYVAVSPEEDLLRRSDEYLMYAAANWASTSQKYSKSATATAAIEADKCAQRYADPDARQEADHGAEVTHTDGETVCWHCGESFGVDQQETLTERRVATDGGTQTADPADARQEADSGGLRSAWPDARAAGRVGGETVERECGHPEASDTCPLCASETEAPDHTVSGEVPIPDGATAPESPDLSVESVGRRPAQWEPVAIVDKAPEEPEETLIGSPGGSPFGSVVVAGVESVGGKVDRSHLQPEWLRGPEPWASSPLTEEEVRSGEVPPPELVAREYAERHSGDRVTAKEWSPDWYADRYERDGAEEETHGLDEEPVREYARTHPEASVVEVLGRFGLGSSQREFVEELVASE